MGAAVLDSGSPVAADWNALGCAVRVVVCRPDDLEVATDLLRGELAAIDLACSRFRDDSELMRLASAAGRPVPVSPLLAEAIGAALDAAEATGGDVDPTVGAAMNAIGYDRDFAVLDPAGSSITVASRPVPGWRQVTVDRDANTVALPSGVQLDLGATAKALAADRAAQVSATALDGRGVLVSLGGDIAVAGDPPAAGWSVRVQDVTGRIEDDPAGPCQTVSIRGGGLATSSTSARRWARGGRVMHHILDPRTGVPVASSWRTVSVAAPSCLAANVASTAAIVRGSEAIGWLTRHGLAARLVDVAGSVTTLPGWPSPHVASTQP